ncbi:MAG: PAS domain-containing protein [Anaerolineae bacterium]|nr:PAS domain-containing protein [Anaerolineae bacterium]
MPLQFPPIVLFYALGAGGALYVAWLCWRARPARGAFWCALLMLSGALWAFTAGLAAMVSDELLAHWVNRLQYVGVMGVVYAWGAFTLVYSYYERWACAARSFIWRLSPSFFYTLMFTSQWHGAFHEVAAVRQANGYTFVDFETRTLFWFWAFYAYSILVGGSALLALSILRFPRLYRGQARLLVAGITLPLVLNVLFLVFGTQISGPYDPTSLSYPLTGLFFWLAITRYRFLDIVPVAHDLVFRAVQSGVLVLDSGGKVIDMNPAAEVILNKPLRGAQGKTMLQAFPHYADLIARFRDYQMLRDEIFVDGRFYELQLMPMTNRAGEPSGRIVMLYDITSQKHALQELDAYARSVAHDLKTPLGVVQSYSQLLELGRTSLDAQTVADYLTLIRRNAQKMTTIIDSLLLLASVRNQNEVELRSLDMGQVFSDALLRLGQAQEKSKTHLVSPASWPTAQGYAPWVEEIWVNYLSNALKYGGTPPIIEVGAAPLPENKVRYWVKDNGSGLSEVDQKKLFTEFGRLQQHLHLEGHGLGLSIVQRIVHRLGGEVGVEGAQGVGSTFYFTLPTAPNGASSAEHDQPYQVLG